MSAIWLQLKYERDVRFLLEFSVCNGGTALREYLGVDYWRLFARPCDLLGVIVC